MSQSTRQESNEIYSMAQKKPIQQKKKIKKGKEKIIKRVSDIEITSS